MEADAKYARACLPLQAARVCGVRLQPFCLGHLMVLQRACSPFVCGQFTEASPEDLVLALWVCSRPAVEAIAGFQRGWGLRWRMLLWRVRICQRRERMRYITRLALFQEYVTAHFERIPVWQESGKTSPSSLPIVLLYQRCLMSFYGCSEAQALNTPLPQVIWLYHAYLDAHGAISFISAAEQEIFDEIENMKTEANPEPAKEQP